jgi:hypothetical protein
MLSCFRLATAAVIANTAREGKETRESEENIDSFGKEQLPDLLCRATGRQGAGLVNKAIQIRQSSDHG